ncbi:MAG: hypothetical protein IJA60_02760 [Clostridia bacterium]|nr:hypothetical protein [Clostridia bacterium]
MEKIKVNADGTFNLGKYEFINFGEENGRVIAVCKDRLFDSRFGDNNDFRSSDIMKRLTEEVLPEIENIVGAENVLEFETDLLSLDGSAKYGVMTSRISIPTLDFYRKNRPLFEKHKLDKYWWLATPDSTDEYFGDNWCLCVSPSGDIYDFYVSYGCRGVRPFLNFVSSIFVSCDD